MILVKRKFIAVFLVLCTSLTLLTGVFALENDGDNELKRNPLNSVIYVGEGNGFGDSLEDKLIFYFDDVIEIEEDDEYIQITIKNEVGNEVTLTTFELMSYTIEENMLVLAVEWTFEPVPNISNWVVIGVTNLIDAKTNKAVVFPVEGVEIISRTYIVGVSDIDNKEVDFGTPFSDVEFPETVEVILENGFKLEVKVNWKAVSSPKYDSLKAGNYGFEGSFIELPNYIVNINDLKATVNVVVKEEVKPVVKIVRVSDIDDIVVDHGTTYGNIKLPEKVIVILEDDTQLRVKIDWEEESNPLYNPQTAGVYEFKGFLIELPQNVINENNLITKVNVTVKEGEEENKGQAELPKEEITATVRITPRTMNLKSQGGFVTVDVRFPGVRQLDKNLDLSEIQLVYNGSVVKAHRVQVSGQAIKLQFDRNLVASVLEIGSSVEIFIKGRINRQVFSGSDSISVIDPGKGGEK